MTIIKRSVKVRSSPRRVWRFLTDLERFHEWTPVKMKLTSEKTGLWGNVSHYKVLRTRSNRDVSSGKRMKDGA